MSDANVVTICVFLRAIGDKYSWRMYSDRDPEQDIAPAETASIEDAMQKIAAVLWWLRGRVAVRPLCVPAECVKPDWAGAVWEWYPIQTRILTKDPEESA